MDENDFLALFDETVEVVYKPLEVPQAITFTQGALDKAFAIGKIVNEITWGNYEWHGVLLVKKDDPLFIIRDIFIAEGARIAPGATNLDAQTLSKAAEGVTALNKEKGANYNIIGVIHSHGSGGVFHSPQDDEAFVHVINSYCGATNTHFRKPVKLIEGQKESKIEDGRLILSGSKLEDTVIKLTPPAEEELRKMLASKGVKIPTHVNPTTIALEMLLQSKIDAEQTVSSGFAYSVVVNILKETYAEIGIREFGILTGQEQTRKIKNPEVHTVEAENDAKYEEKALLDEVTDKFEFVTGNGAGLKWSFGNLKRVWSAKKKGYEWKEEDKAPPKSMWRRSRIPNAPEQQPAWDGEICAPVGQEQPSFWRSLVEPFVEPFIGEPQPVASNSIAPVQELADKLEDKESIVVGDLIWQFIYSSLGYVSRFRDKDCIYSEHFGYVLSMLGDYARSFDEISMRDAFKLVYEMTGGIKADGQKVYVPKLDQSIFYLRKRIAENLAGDEEQIAFMISFSKATNIEEQNKLIREYSMKFANIKDEAKDDSK